MHGHQCCQSHDSESYVFYIPLVTSHQICCICTNLTHRVARVFALLSKLIKHPMGSYTLVFIINLNMIHIHRVHSFLSLSFSGWLKPSTLPQQLLDGIAKVYKLPHLPSPDLPIRSQWKSEVVLKKELYVI